MSGAKVVTFYLIPNSYRLKRSNNFNLEQYLVNRNTISKS